MCTQTTKVRVHGMVRTYEVARGVGILVGTKLMCSSVSVAVDFSNGSSQSVKSV